MAAKKKAAKKAATKQAAEVKEEIQVPSEEPVANPGFKENHNTILKPIVSKSILIHNVMKCVFVMMRKKGESLPLDPLFHSALMKGSNLQTLRNHRNHQQKVNTTAQTLYTL